MDIYISRDGSQLGPYRQSDVEKMLTDGQLLESDLAWCENLPEWVPLSTLVEKPQPLKTPKQQTPVSKRKKPKDWSLVLIPATFAGYGLIFFGLWSSCSAKESWMSRGLSYEKYQETEAVVFRVILLGLVLIAPSVWASFSRKKDDLSREIKKSEEFDRKVRDNPNHCPNCGSDDFDTFHPSKPRVWSSPNFGSLLASAAANGLADAMFKPERVCTGCGCRWPAPQ